MGGSLAVFRALMTLMLARRGGLRLTLVAGLAEEFAALGLGIAAPFLLRRAVDRLPSAGALELVALITLFVLSWIAPNWIAALKAPKTARLTDHLYRHISRGVLQRQLPRLVQAGDTDSGRLAGVLERLPLSLQMVLDGLVWRATPLIVQLAVSVVALAVALPLQYSGLLSLTLVVYVILSNFRARRLGMEAQRFNQIASSHSAVLSDVLRNADRIICNGGAVVEIEGVQRSAGARARSQLGLAHALLAASSLQFVVLGLGLSLVLTLAGFDVVARRLRVGDFVLLQAFALRLTSPLGGLVLTVRQAVVSLANIGEALDLGELETAVGPVAVVPTREGAGLRLEHVSYAYTKSAGVFDVSLTLDPDQLVAMVGANGSGKSTLARLMGGVLAPQLGGVWVNGEPLQTLEPSRRPELVLYSPQFISLFNRSLRDNGCYPPGRQTSATLARRLDQWTFSSDGESVDLDATAGERGRRLSGGQIQKLELARLCAVDSPVLILDESTSALDGPSEADALRTLRACCAGRLLVLVTHRLSLVESADLVLFLQDGRLAGTGPHRQLLDRPEYNRLWSLVSVE